jgi:hypothetical protein
MDLKNQHLDLILLNVIKNNYLNCNNQFAFNAVYNL